MPIVCEYRRATGPVFLRVNTCSIDKTRSGTAPTYVCRKHRGKNYYNARITLTITYKIRVITSYLDAFIDSFAKLS